jgi:hypothetical protein
MQDQFGNYWEEMELKMADICEGSDEYKENMKCLKTTIQKLKSPEGAKGMQVLKKRFLLKFYFYC